MPFLEPADFQSLPVFIICADVRPVLQTHAEHEGGFQRGAGGRALAGITWHAYNSLGLHLASRAVNASEIYGGLALIPFLMIGLYIVWLTCCSARRWPMRSRTATSYLQEQSRKT